MYTPMLVVSVLAICRFIKIRYPFKVLNLKVFIMLAILFQFYLIGISSWMTFGDNAWFVCEYGMILRSFKIPSEFQALIHAWPVLVTQFASLGTSILTVLHLIKETRKPLTASSNRNGIKSSSRILVQNFGGFLQTAAQIAKVIMLSRFMGEDNSPMYLRIAMFTLNVMTYAVLSALNPVVFVFFTPDVLKIITPSKQRNNIQTKASRAKGELEEKIELNRHQAPKSNQLIKRNAGKISA
jgi:hypothetical protein